ncbi:unnamed protein product [Rodentolepis nana]|uniref:Cadherin_C domain-containing protein n=1 Tax=Rodentolepis nana TaxID=102285 RepID=A0A0R3TVK8_RODNA|nr:unnamed protein product [Rodentolepis nana]
MQHENCTLSTNVVVAALGLLAVEIYFEDIERNLIVKSLILSNDSQTSQILTQKTIVDLQVHLFNITNSEEVVGSEAKPKLQTVGPYVYRRETKKEDITYTDECESKKCLEYSESSQMYFEANKSSAFPENETITVPNIVRVLNDTFDGPFTINTGEGDITKLGELEAFKGMTLNDIWDTDYANMLNGTSKNKKVS